MHKRTYLNACLVLALAAGASQASAAPGASEMAGDVAVLQASPASTGHARFANPNAATSAAGIHFAAPPARRVARAAPLAPARKSSRPAARTSRSTVPTGARSSRAIP